MLNTNQQQESEEIDLLFSSMPLTPNVLLLDDMNWKFQLLPTVEEALALVHRDIRTTNANDNESTTTTSEQDWSSIRIPGNWMLQGFDDVPIYTNQKYPFPCQPPIVPRQNPTGCYRLHISLPSDWHAEHHEDDQYSIVLHGIESACFVYWNGKELGFFKDSRLPSEFFIPRHLLSLGDATNRDPVLHLVVARWSDGSYLEDQDHWWMAGIHRSVELIRRRPGADIVDYKVRSSASGHLSVSVKMRKASVPMLVTARLFADEQLTADGDWKAASNEIWSQQKLTTTGGTATVASTNTSTESSSTTVTLAFKGRIDNVQRWTAETPNLYTLVLEEERPSGTTSDVEGEHDSWLHDHKNQVESCRVGFRTIDITNGVLRCNQEKIMICGINRHEHDPDHGKVVSLDRMKQDITVLKRNNFNAIRTSHYPAHSSFYKLCDFYGMYVCDEANIETHGMKPMGRLAHDQGWEQAFVERVRRMVQRDINHPCIIMWSLGNESGRGRNLVSARQSLLDLDTDRPICYEGGGSWSEGIGRTELTDIVCPMYPNVDEVVRQAIDPKEDRPVILCEYSHSMNNSNGNLHLYWRAFRRFERLQGGFIWDMIDQGLRKKAKDGRSYFGYGGDFGVGQPSDRQFCINGMFSPDRYPHPSVSEIKYLQQPVTIDALGSKNFDPVASSSLQEIAVAINGTATPILLRIKNIYSFSNLSHLSWRWKLHCSHSSEPLMVGTATDEYDLATIDISPAVKKICSIVMEEDDFSSILFFLDIEGFLNEDTTWAMSGHVLATKQIPLRITYDDDQSLSIRREIGDNKKKKESLRVSSDKNTIKVSNGNDLPFVTIDHSTGGILSINWDGTPILAGGVTPNFMRAATDNDRGGVELVLEFLLLAGATSIFRLLFGDSGFSYETNWKQCGLSLDSPPKVVCDSIRVSKELGDLVEIEALIYILSNQTGKAIIEQVSTYEIHRDGRISLANKVKPLARVSLIPRVGLSFRLNPSFHEIQYFGRGPLENYPDRKSGSHFGWWKTSASNMGYNYIVPSENGSRSDCRRVCFESGRDGGMAVIADPDTAFSCSALLHSAEELHHALHTYDLDRRADGTHPIHVNIDHRLMGVGGDDSWSPCVYPDFVVKGDQDYNYKVWFVKIPPATK